MRSCRNAFFFPASLRRISSGTFFSGSITGCPYRSTYLATTGENSRIDYRIAGDFREDDVLFRDESKCTYREEERVERLRMLRLGMNNAKWMVCADGKRRQLVYSQRMNRAEMFGNRLIRKRSERRKGGNKDDGQCEKKATQRI